MTSQAVSRWENGEVEPSISTLSEMAKIFNVTIDAMVNEDISIEDMFKEPELPKVETVVEEKIVYAEAPKVHLCLCEKCNRPIYQTNDVHRFTTKESHRRGRNTTYTNTDHIYCTNCYNKKLEDEAKAKALAEAERKDEIRTRRVHSFIWPTIVAIIFLIVGIVNINKDKEASIGCFVLAGLSFTFVADLILDNNFIGDLWIGIASWSVKLPGVIFSLDLDGIIWLITVKILGALLSIFISIAAAILATLVGMALSIFAYPFALAKNIKEIE